MSKWVKQVEDTTLPAWLKDNLKSECECGGSMENFYNDENQITFRRCNNPNCPQRMAQKIVAMCDLLKVKGIGPETASKLIRVHNLSNQYQVIPYILNDKPKVSLYNFLRMSFTKGIDTGWSSVTDKCNTLDEVFTTYKGDLSPKIKEIEPLLRDGEKYVEIIKPMEDELPTLITGTVMLSGTIRGFNDRNDFIRGLNFISKGAVKLSISESKRKTGIMALIQEADTPHRGKWECANENGIPIMTPDEFKEYIGKLFIERKSKMEVK